ncbi:MAG TPA: hypothetical protein VJ853_04135 [Thermoanaerobaculia bacterium]|nr:hypothetical protein [Thermoanaerobaculia bacterium]
MTSTVLILVAVAAVGVLMWMLRKRSASDALARYSDRRRDSSRLVGRGEFIDGSRRMQVALALTDGTLYYENSDMQGSLERQWIHEVEYDDELTTGQSIGGATVLRLRCFSQTFEFLLPKPVVREWKLALPPHHMSSPDAAGVAMSVAGEAR